MTSEIFHLWLIKINPPRMFSRASRSMAVSVVTAGTADDVKSRRLRSVKMTFISALYFIDSRLWTRSAKRGRFHCSIYNRPTKRHCIVIVDFTEQQQQHFMFVVIIKTKTTLSDIMHSMVTVKQLPHVFLTGQSQLTICERKISGIKLLGNKKFSKLKICASVYDTSESFLSKATFKRKLSDGFTLFTSGHAGATRTWQHMKVKWRKCSGQSAAILLNAT